MALERFLAVRDNLRVPRFVASRSLEAVATGDPWRRHAESLAVLRARETESPSSPAAPPVRPGRSLLDLKIELADRALVACDLCPHHCRVDRNRGERGFCGVGSGAAVHWEGVLWGEELPLAPSHEVFLSGCTMRCAFCYSHEHITRPMSGRATTPLELAACAASRRREGAANLNLVGGEPIVHIATILRALRLLESPLPVVWNSNMYATPEAMALLDGVVDLFLGDIHFGNEACARRLGRIPDYLPSVTAAFETAVESGASVIIRHLVMPGHIDCCARLAMEWAARALPETPFHLMFQYVPDYRARGDAVLGRVLTGEEIARCLRLAEETGVRLYHDGPPGPVRSVAAEQAGPASSEGVGETVDLLIHADGRVSFTRLLETLLPVADALSPADGRVRARAARQAERV